MTGFLTTVADTVIDRSPEELIGAIVVALGLSMAVSGFYTRGRRKIGDQFMLMNGLVLVANVAAMAFAVGYLAYQQKVDEFPEGKLATAASCSNPSFLLGHTPGAESFLAPWVVGLADANKDGRVTPEEAAQFVKEADTGGRGSVDQGQIAEALRIRWTAVSGVTPTCAAQGPYMAPAIQPAPLRTAEAPQTQPAVEAR